MGRIEVEDASIRPTGMMVHTLNSTKTATLEEINLKVTVGLCEFEIPFFVVDIPTVFNLFLGDLGFTLPELSLPMLSLPTSTKGKIPFGE